MMFTESALVKVKAPEDDGARVAQAHHCGGVAAGGEILVGERAECRWRIFQVKEILDRDRHAVQRSAIATGVELCGRSFRLRHR